MIPCSRLYGFLGCSLAAAHGNRNSSNSSSSPYWSWVETYSGDDYLVRRSSAGFSLWIVVLTCTDDVM